MADPGTTSILSSNPRPPGDAAMGDGPAHRGSVVARGQDTTTPSPRRPGRPRTRAVGGFPSTHSSRVPASHGPARGADDDESLEEEEVPRPTKRARKSYGPRATTLDDAGYRIVTDTYGRPIRLDGRGEGIHRSDGSMLVEAVAANTRALQRSIRDFQRMTEPSVSSTTPPSDQSTTFMRNALYTLGGLVGMFVVKLLRARLAAGAGTNDAIPPQPSAGTADMPLPTVPAPNSEFVSLPSRRGGLR